MMNPVTVREPGHGLMDAIFILNDCRNICSKKVTAVSLVPYIPSDDDFIWDKCGRYTYDNDKWHASDRRLELLQKDFMCDRANDVLDGLGGKHYKYYISHLTQCWMVLPDECVQWVGDPYNHWVDGISLQGDREDLCTKWLWFVPKVRTHTERLDWHDPDLCRNPDAVRLAGMIGLERGTLEEARLRMVALSVSREMAFLDSLQDMRGGFSFI